MALLAIAFIGLLGLAVDMARMYIAKTELSRAVDAAALAGVVELPDVDAAQARADAYLQANLGDASATFPSPAGDHQIKIKGTRTVDTLFMSVFGFGDIDISATAAAGFGITPVDAVLSIDATGSMGANPPCNSSDSNSGCPIWEAKNAAKNFVNVLINGTSSSTAIGVNPYRGCYNAPRTHSGCVTLSQVANLSSSEAALDAKIDSITAVGGTGTNTCLGLHKANEVIFGAGSHPGSNTLRFVVILADGDNTWNSAAFSSTQGGGHPPVACRATTSPSNSDGDVTTNCLAAQTRERQVDVKTQEMASAMKSSGVEIFVVGFGVCGSSSTAKCDTTKIGNTDHDNLADRNLLKCMASSSANTNDHYYEVPTATDLPAVFQDIANAIAFRLIE
jgi:hypothetical protein